MAILHFAQHSANDQILRLAKVVTTVSNTDLGHTPYEKIESIEYYAVVLDFKQNSVEQLESILNDLSSVFNRRVGDIVRDWTPICAQCFDHYYFDQYYLGGIIPHKSGCSSGCKAM